MTKGTESNPGAPSADSTRVGYQNAAQRDRIEQRLLSRHLHRHAKPEERSRMNPPQLSRIDSPLAKIFLSEYISRLAQETIRYRALSYKRLAQQMSVPSPALQEAIKGQLGLGRGQWNMLGQLLGLTTAFQVRLSERHGQACWEAYFPPVSVQPEENTKQELTGVGS